MSRRIVTLRNSGGHALHGILEEPAGGVSGASLAAVLLCPGVKTRVAPHRLYRKLLGPFLARGIPVLRVDFAGLGDSEGEWSDNSLDHIYGMIERGHCVDDARSAFDWLEAQWGIRRFIAGGLCGGAMTALHASVQDSRLAALYAIGLPAVFQGLTDEVAPTTSELRAHRLRYVRKLLKPSAWLRFLSMKSDYRLMWRMLLQGVGAKEPAPQAEAKAPSQSASQSPSSSLGRGINPYLPLTLLSLLAAGRPALALFGEDDPLRHSFEERFMQPWWSALEQYKALFSYAVIPSANHILGDPDAVAEANRLTTLWLDAVLAEQQASRGLGWSGVRPPPVARPASSAA